MLRPHTSSRPRLDSFPAPASLVFLFSFFFYLPLSRLLRVFVLEFEKCDVTSVSVEGLFPPRLSLFSLPSFLSHGRVVSQWIRTARIHCLTTRSWEEQDYPLKSFLLMCTPLLKQSSLSLPRYLSALSPNFRPHGVVSRGGATESHSVPSHPTVRRNRSKPATHPFNRSHPPPLPPPFTFFVLFSLLFFAVDVSCCLDEKTRSRAPFCASFLPTPPLFIRLRTCNRLRSPSRFPLAPLVLSLPPLVGLGVRVRRARQGGGERESETHYFFFSLSPLPVSLSFATTIGSRLSRTHVSF